MAEELRFAIKCHGSSQKPKHRKRVCSKCKSLTHKSDCPLKVIRTESVNGTVHMRERRNSREFIPRSTGDFEMDYLHDKCDFGAGGYLHVEYSDTDS